MDKVLGVTLSGSALICGFGNAVMIQAYGSSFGHRFVFGESLWLRAYVSASGVCLDVWESIANAGMRDSFGIVRPSGKPGEKRRNCKLSRKALEARRRESVCFPC